MAVPFSQAGEIQGSHVARYDILHRQFVGKRRQNLLRGKDAD